MLLTPPPPPPPPPPPLPTTTTHSHATGETKIEFKAEEYRGKYDADCLTNHTFEVIGEKYFRRARKAFGVSEKKYVASMGTEVARKRPTARAIGPQEAAGKSGSFFFLSDDQHFVVKSMTSEEVESFGRFLPPYIRHLEGAGKDFTL